MAEPGLLNFTRPGQAKGEDVERWVNFVDYGHPVKKVAVSVYVLVEKDLSHTYIQILLSPSYCSLRP